MLVVMSILMTACTMGLLKCGCNNTSERLSAARRGGHQHRSRPVQIFVVKRRSGVLNMRERAEKTLENPENPDNPDMTLKPSRQAVVRREAILQTLIFLFLSVLGAKAAGESEPRFAALLSEARELATGGRLKEAIVKVENRLPAITNVADRVGAHELLGDLHQQAQTHSDITNAIRHYERALALNPKFAPLYLKQARLQFMLPERHPQAMAAVQQYLSLGQTNVEALYLLGSLYKFAAESDTNSPHTCQATLMALETYQALLRLDGNHAGALGNTADIAFNLGQYPAAAALYEKLIELPTAPELRWVATTRLAHTQTKLGNFGRANDLLQEADSGLAKIPATLNPMENANLQIERVRVLAYRMENSQAAGDSSRALAHGRELQSRVAELSKSFTSPQLKQWEQAARALAESSR